MTRPVKSCDEGVGPDELEGLDRIDRLLEERPRRPTPLEGRSYGGAYGPPAKNGAALELIGYVLVLAALLGLMVFSGVFE